MTQNEPPPPQDPWNEGQPPVPPGWPGRPQGPGQPRGPGQPPGYPPGYGYQRPGFPPTPRELNLAMWAHLAPLLAGFAIAILGGITSGLLGGLVLFVWVIPLVLRENQGRQSAYVRWHATESLNFQLTLLGAIVVSGILIFVLIGILLMIAVAIFALVSLIIAAMKANQGAWYRYPVSIRFVK